MNYTAENMSRMLGNEATNADAERFAAYLLARGWELCEDDGQIHASRNGEAMTEAEWQAAIADCYNGPMMMNPSTGSVAPESEWRADFQAMTPEEWGGDTFEAAWLVEVVPDGNGWWKEAE